MLGVAAQVSYRSYWTHVVLEVLHDHRGNLSIKDISDVRSRSPREPSRVTECPGHPGLPCTMHAGLVKLEITCSFLGEGCGWDGGAPFGAHMHPRGASSAEFGRWALEWCIDGWHGCGLAIGCAGDGNPEGRN